MTDYTATYSTYLSDPQNFWMEQSGLLSWIESPSLATGDAGWFPDGVINACHACVDTHVKSGHGDQTALIYDSPVSGKKRAYSYAELLEKIAVFAGGLKAHGVGYGGRVLIYAPMIPEAVIAMLATVRRQVF